MKILQVNKPLQDNNTQSPEHVQKDGYIPTWCVRTELFPHKLGGLKEFIRRKEMFVNQKGLEGLYLYEITGRFQQGGNSFEKEMVYYIRYDYIKKR